LVSDLPIPCWSVGPWIGAVHRGESLLSSQSIRFSPSRAPPLS
jgi:hypothetical protein